MNISPDKQTEIIATLAKVDERTETILKRMDKYESHFQDQLNDISKRVGVLETGKSKVLGMAAAAAMFISCLAYIGGDYVKSVVMPQPVQAAEMHHTK